MHDETFRMLGAEREADLAREARTRSLAAEARAARVAATKRHPRARPRLAARLVALVPRQARKGKLPRESQPSTSST